MVGWLHWLKGHESEQTQGDVEGQGSLTCYSQWGCKVRHGWVTKQQQNMATLYSMESLILFEVTSAISKQNFLNYSQNNHEGSLGIVKTAQVTFIIDSVTTTREAEKNSLVFPSFIVEVEGRGSEIP